MSEREIFLALLDLPNPEARARFLDETCGADRAWRAQLEALLRSHESASSFLSSPAVDPPLRYEASTHEQDSVGAAAGTPARDADLTFLAAPGRPDSLGRIGHYEVLEVLGRGGFGIVFRAFDEILQRVVAVKVLAPQLAVTSPARKRFLREARSSAKVRHENVVQVYAVEEQPLPYLVMEFIPGETLQQRLDRAGPLEPMEVVQIGRQIAEGLAAAHSTGLIHRDIKPGNILIEADSQQHVKITDFGLARAADDASLTQSGYLAGTPLFMAPEQAEGAVLDHRADLFSLGSVLYTMCSGRSPFRANSTLAVLKRVAEDTPRPIQEIIPEVPQWLCDLISRLHAKKPQDRIATAREVADLLARGQMEMHHPQKVTTSPGVAPVAVAKLPPLPAFPAVAPAQRWRFHTRRLAAAAAVVVLLLAGLGFTEATGGTNLRGTVIRLFSPQGTLIVEVDDPNVSVQIDGEDLIITGAGAKEIRLKPGSYTVEARKGQKVVSRELITVTKNGRQIVRVHQDPLQLTEDRSEWERTTAGLPAKEQVQAVIARLRGLNPGFDGMVYFKIENGVVTELRIDSKDVGNITPLRVLRGLTSLICSNTKVTDLSPLKGMKLKHLGTLQSTIADLTPLHGMPLTSLDLYYCVGVTNLKPLQGMPLEYLNLTGLTVSDLTVLREITTLRYLVLDKMPLVDLTPLEGLKLYQLQLKGTKVLGLQAIRSSPLKVLTLDYHPDHEELVRSFKGLERINQLSVAEFWKAVAADADRRAAEYVISLGGGVQVNDVDSQIGTVAGLPREPFRLTWIILVDKKPLSAEGWAYFKQCKNLTGVMLEGNSLGELRLDSFKECKTLTSLVLSFVMLSDAELAHLKDNKKLTTLDLYGSHLSDGGLEHFKGCTGLENLRLGLTPVSDQGLTHFKDCKKLLQLRLNHAQVSDAGLAHFKECKQLTVLEVGETQVSDGGLAHFKECKNLKTLVLFKTQIGDAGLAHFKDCADLTALWLWETQVSDKSLELLKKFKNLTELRVQKTKITAAGVEELKKALPKCKIEWDGGTIEPR